MSLSSKSRYRTSNWKQYKAKKHAKNHLKNNRKGYGHSNADIDCVVELDWV